MSLFFKKKINKQVQFEKLIDALGSITLNIDNSIKDNFFDFNSFHDSLDLNFTISTESVYSWYRRIHFQKKTNDYKRLKKKWLERISLLETSENNLLNIDGPLAKKYSLLTRIINIAELLSQEYDEAAEANFLQFENEFLAYLSREDKFILNASGVVKLEEKSLLQIYTKYLKGHLAYLIRVLRIKLNRDLRQFLRNIIRFHFKNMNDETDAEQLFLNHNLIKDLFTYNFNFHVLKRYYFTTATCA